MTADCSVCSVIIPCYNYGRYLAQALDSALAQTCPPRQIIVVDDGSTDNTRAVAESYSAQGVIYVYQENQGVSQARNTAIGHAGGRYIALLDADDAWHPRKLELQVSLMERDSRIGAVGTQVTSWPGTFEPILAEAGQVAFVEVTLGSLVCSNGLAASSVMLRKEAIAALLPEVFDRTLKGAEDWDCWLRIADNWKVGNLPLPLSGFRDQLTGAGSQPHVMGPGLLRTLQKIEDRGVWRRPDMKPFRRKALAQVWASRALMKAAQNQNLSAIVDTLRSLVSYPAPIGVRRDKLLLVSALRMLGLKKPHGQAQLAG